MSNPDLDLIYRVLHGELKQIPYRDRKRYRWILRWDMFTWIRSVAVEEVLSGPGAMYVNMEELAYVNMEELAAMTERLIGLPVEIREGVEGIHLEVAG